MKKLLLSFFLILSTAVLIAQESTADPEITMDATNDVWYASPWVWVAGAALVIVLLVLLSKGKDAKR